jgi:hypothetical protein
MLSPLSLTFHSLFQYFILIWICECCFLVEYCALSVDVIHPVMQHNIPEEFRTQLHCCKNLKSHIWISVGWKAFFVYIYALCSFTLSWLWIVEVLLYLGSSGVVPYCSLMVHNLVHVCVLSIASLRLLWYLVFSSGCLCYIPCLWCVTVMTAGIIFFACHKASLLSFTRLGCLVFQHLFMNK